MDNQNDATSNLEHLLESLIRMVGRANNTVDTLQRRVAQLECIVKEQQHPCRTQFILRKKDDDKELTQ